MVVETTPYRNEGGWKRNFHSSPRRTRALAEAVPEISGDDRSAAVWREVLVPTFFIDSIR